MSGDRLMGTSLPSKWHKPDEPDAGVFTLITICGHTSPSGEIQRPLYVVSSDEGFLNDSFGFDDPRWSPYYDPTEIRDQEVTVEKVDQEIKSMDKFARNGWSYGYADGTLSVRGQRIQNMLRRLREILFEMEDDDHA